MKDSAVERETAGSESPESAFQRFAKTMRALIAVSKEDLDKKLEQEKDKKKGAKIQPSAPDPT
jgi:hypothetical protein